MSCIPWQSMHSAVMTRGVLPELASEALIPWKSFRYVATTSVERPYFVITALFVWHFAHASTS